MKISKKEVKGIAKRFYQDGDSASKIAGDFGVTAQTILNTIDSLFPVNATKKSKISIPDMRKIIKKYAKDPSSFDMKKFAKVHGVTPVTIRNILKKAGVYKPVNKKHVRLSDDQKQEMIKGYQEGKSGRQLAEQFDISYQCVYDILKRLKVERRKVNDYERERKIHKDKHQEVIDKYMNGVSSGVLAKEYGVSVGSIFKILNSNKVNVRPVQLVPEEEYPNIIRLYTKEKLGIYKIGKKYGVHGNTIYAILKKLKVKMRPKWFKKILPQKYPRIVERYKRGDKVEKIAKDYGVTVNSIRHILEKLKVTETKQMSIAFKRKTP